MSPVSRTRRYTEFWWDNPPQAGRDIDQSSVYLAVTGQQGLVGDRAERAEQPGAGLRECRLHRAEQDGLVGY